MRGLTRFRPSPAMLVAFVALVAATAGGAIAADALVTSAGVKNNSLTGADIRNNSISGADIRNRSIGPADLTAAARGRSGPAGPAGAAGPAGPAGAPGPSAGFAYDSGPSDLAWNDLDQVVATLPLPAGNYVLSAKVLATNDGALVTVSCNLSLGQSVIDTAFPLSLDTTDRDYFPLSGRGSLAAAGSVAVTCNGGPSGHFRDRQIEAIQVGSLP